MYLVYIKISPSGLKGKIADAASRRKKEKMEIICND
jgi:hypothetical protein